MFAMYCPHQVRPRKAEKDFKQIHGKHIEVSQGPTLQDHLPLVMTVAAEVTILALCQIACGAWCPYSLSAQLAS